MKRHLYKIVAGVIVGVSAVTMTACSATGTNNEVVGDNQNKIPMGRYMEENIKTPEAFDIVTQYTIDKSGNMTLYGYDKNNTPIAYSSQDGSTWKEEEISWFKTLEDKGSYVMSVVVGQDDATYVLYGNRDGTYTLSQVNEDGTLRELPCSASLKSGMPYKVEVLENGDILLSNYYDGVTRYSGTDGTRLTEYEAHDGEFTVVGNQLAVADMQRGGVVFYDIATGKEEKLVAYEGKEDGNKLIADEENNLYLVNSLGISRLANGGNTWENIIESGMSSFGKPSLYLKNISISNEGFNVLFGDQVEGYEMLKYTYNPDVPSVPTTEVNIYMLEDNMTMRQAAAEYQRQNPEVIIRLQVGMKAGEAKTKSDAIRALNTELLAGKGPDIIILDGLPIDSYIDKGVLLDMNEFIGPMVAKDELLGNIMEAYTQNNNIFAVPTSFELPMMWGDADLLKEVSSIEDLAAWADEHSDEQVMYSMSSEMILKMFYGAGASNWLDEKGQIKEQEFITFIEAVKRLSDVDAKSTLNENEYYETQHFSREYVAYSDTQVHIEPLTSFLFMSAPYSIINQRGDGDFKVVESNGKGIYEARGIIGINANSKNVDIAKGIVQTALSKQVQNVDLGEGFAVNTEAFNRQSDPNSQSGMIMALGMTMPGSRPIEFAEPGVEVYNKVAKQAREVSQPAHDDEVLLQMIIEETKGYFDGTKTAEEAAGAVAQRTKAYLTE